MKYSGIWPKTFLILAVNAAVGLPSLPALAAGLTIPSGSSLSLGSGQIDMGCGDLEVLGTFNMETGRSNRAGSVTIETGGELNGSQGIIEFGNHWNNRGSFNAATSFVTLVDECSDTASFNGDSTFYNLSMETSAGKVVVLEADRQQTVMNDLVLTGAAGNLLTLRSSIEGSHSYFQLVMTGSQLINYVDVRDNWALNPGQHLALGWPNVFNSLDSGNNFRWFYNFEVTEAVPSLSDWSLILLIAATLMSARFIFRQLFGQKVRHEMARFDAKRPF